MAFDAAMGETVLFGGTGPAIVNATWAYNGSTWTELSPTTSPSPRLGASMAYDPSTNQLILFGGDPGTTDTSLGDTWEWNGTTWTKLAPVTNPPGRYFASMAYDTATNQLVLYGGFEVGGGNLSDTWTWNGTNWIKAAELPGPAVYGASMAFDASSSQLILFGGANEGRTAITYNNQTWSWNGTAWTQLGPVNSPPARAQASMAYDPALSRLVLFGGIASDNSTFLTDTWTWGGSAWDQSIPATSPTTGLQGSMTYDAHANQLLYFGGQSQAVDSNQTWSLTPVPVNCAAPPGPSVNWAGCNLAGKNLAGANLTGASMAFANLTGANLYATSLTGASFYGATLNGAKFPYATMTNADLSYASLTGATLDHTGMIGVFLTGTYLSKATLTSVQSGGISGTPSVLPADTKLVSGYLVGPTANLLNAQLAGANLAGAITYGSNFSGANLSTANLSGANLAFDTFSSASNLFNANLSNANLSGSGTLDRANRTGGIWTGATCPNGKPAAPSC